MVMGHHEAEESTKFFMKSLCLQALVVNTEIVTFGDNFILCRY